MSIELSTWAYAASEQLAQTYPKFDVVAAAYTIDGLAVEPAIAQLRADLASVTAERDGYVSDIERFVWNLAGCDTIASGWGKPGDYAKSMALPALDSVSRMAADHAALRARVAELEKEAMILRGTVEAVTTRRQQAEQRVAEVEVQAERYRLATLRQDAENMLLQQRNTELVAALDYIAKWVEADGADEKYDREILRVCALARAESAAQEASK